MSSVSSSKSSTFISTDTDFDDGIEDEFSDENEEDSDESDYSLEISSDDENANDEFDDLSNENNEPLGDNDEEDLKSEVEALKAQLKGNDTEEFNDETEDEFGDETDDFDEEEFDDESDEFDDEESYDEELDECGDLDMLSESKQRKMDRIVESVVRRMLKEDELHVFGKHPGYRKKPMELPTTGEDQNQWGRDWNDDSVHSEEPFGKQIGDGDPFKEMVNAVTKDVMYQLKKGVPIEGMNKKKVN
jgi:hypothetical protein